MLSLTACETRLRGCGCVSVGVSILMKVIYHTPPQPVAGISIAPRFASARSCRSLYGVGADCGLGRPVDEVLIEKIVRALKQSL